jgi:uncharacterized protein YxjI
LFCTFCGQEAFEQANFCEACGNNLKSTSQYLDKNAIRNESMQQEFVQYKPVEFVVQQKLLALRPVYRVKDVNGQVFMEVKRPFFNPFIPYLYVKAPDGKPIGHIQGNLWRTEWKITDAEGRLHATLRFPFIMFFRKNFTVDTAYGQFRSGDSIFAYKFDCYDSQGRISFLVDKKILTIRDSFKIKSFGILSPFITTMAAVCIDQRLHGNK